MRIASAIPLVLALALAAPEAGAAKPRPPPCEAGAFAVSDAESPLVPGAAAVPDRIFLGEDGSVALASGCPAVAGKQKASRRGNKLSAKWTKKKGLCTGLLKTASFKASFDPSCATLAGTFKSKGGRRSFVARRLALGSPSLTPTLEAARAATRSVGPAGGEVRARGADGTKYVLLVPPGALAAEVSITMTPASAVGGLPLMGGLVGAVGLEPEGLQFALPAELKVIPRGGLPELAAGFSGTGPANRFDVHLSWEDPERRFASLALSHFSLYGLGIPGPTQLAAFAADTAVLAGWFDLVFSDAVVCEDPCDWETQLAYWYELEVDPRLDAGTGGTAAQALSGHQALWTWELLTGFAAVSEAPEVASRRAAGRTQNHASLLSQRTAYTKPACSGTVSDWKDWLRIPDEIRKAAQALYEGALLAQLEPGLDYCVSLAFRDLSFPDEVGESTTSLPLSLRTVVESPGGDVPVTSKLAISYETDNASGPTQLTSSSDGSVSATVARTLGSPRYVEVRIQAEEADLQRVELSEYEYVAAGSLALAFEAHFDPAPPPYLEPGTEHEVCVQTTIEPFGGQTVFFFLDGPGAISAPDAETLDELTRGRACIHYTAPEAPVAKDLEALLTATLVAGGQTYQDTLHLHPAWVDIRVHADVGEGWVPATNATVDAEGDGPFDLRATFTGNPPLVGDPPPYPPFAQREVTAQTDEQTLRRLGDVDLQAKIIEATDSLGRLTLEWDGVLAGGSVSTITFLSIDPALLSGSDPVSAASVTIDRGGLPDMTVQFPSAVQPGVATPLVVTVHQNGEPAPGYFVEVEAQGGDVDPGEGLSDEDGQLQALATLAPGGSVLILTITLRDEPGAPPLAQQVVQASAGETPRVVVTSREDRAFGATTIRDAVGPISRIGNGATESSDVELDAQGSMVRVESVGSAPPVGTGPQPSTYFQLDFDVVGAPFEATLSAFTAAGVGSSTWLYERTAAGGFTALRCEAPGNANCTASGGSAFTLEPGSYQLQSGASAGTAELDVTFAPAP